MEIFLPEHSEARVRGVEQDDLNRPPTLSSSIRQGRPENLYRRQMFLELQVSPKHRVSSL
jgi:hypothetical protein